MTLKNNCLKFAVLLLIITAVCLVLIDGAKEANAEDETIDCRFAGGFGGRYFDVDYDGQYLYAVHVQGLSIFDVSDPADPEEIGFINTSGYARGVAVEGDFAYVADDENGLVIVNITHKETPTLEGRYDTSGRASRVAISGNYAYVADKSNGLVIVNISDKENPTETGHYDTTGTGWVPDVAVSGGYAYLANGEKGMDIVDVSDPSNPTKEGNYNDGAAYAIVGVAVSGDYAYVMNVNQYGSGVDLEIISISDKENPTMKGEYEFSVDWSPNPDVVVSGDYAFVTVGAYGFSVMDISDKSNPSEEGNLDTKGGASGLVVSGDHAYIADDGNGFIIVDIADKENPAQDGNYNSLFEARGVAVSGTYAYVADKQNGLAIMDISDPELPTFEGRLDTAGDAVAVTVSGDYAYVADYDNGLVIVDITNKTDPQKVGRYDSSGQALGVVVSGNYAYVADRGNGLVIVDITDKTDPQKVGHYDSSGLASGVMVSGNYAYVADASNGLVVVDVSDETNPQKVGSYDTSGRARGVALAGDYAYIADDNNGLVIIDVSDKGDPQEVGQFDTTDDASGVAASENYAYVVDESGALTIVDITQKDNLTKEGYMGTSHRAYSVVISDEHAYVTDNDGGLIIVEMAPIAWLGSISPSPALYTDTIQFTGRGTGHKPITRYMWRSSLDGILHNDTDANFTTSELANGTHTIYFKVKDQTDVWSDEVQTTLVIKGKPRAIIDSISPSPALDTDNIHFEGDYDAGSSIELYVWRSSQDGEFYNGSSSDFFYDALSNNTHTIYFKVKNDEGAWSDEVETSLVINGKPRAIIDSISPSPALDTDNIHFEGDYHEDSSIETYVWRSSQDGEFYNGSSSEFYYDELSNNTHTIYFKVKDDEGAWSDEVQTTLEINGKPRAIIDSISPSPALDTDNIHFEGDYDEDSSIETYVWRSSQDGEFYNGSSPGHDYDGLSTGTHTVSFKVKDDDDAWSDGVQTTLIVHERPVAQIDSISPSPAFDTDEVSLKGSGNDDGSITRYVWRSDLENELHNDTVANFGAVLTAGLHTIYFRVQDNHEVWSEEVSTTLQIYGKPTAVINSITPGPALDTDSIEFNGTDSYDDGTVERYAWRSSLKAGELYNDTNSDFSGRLKAGAHTIYLKVQDAEGIWSEEASQFLVVHERPVAVIESITPPIVEQAKPIHFSGYGSDDGGIIKAYLWDSSIDGIFSTDAEGYLQNLTNGTHTISFRVMDQYDIWSNWTTHGESIIVNGRPLATISAITPALALDTDEIQFDGSGSSDDGNIVRYVWRSSQDGELFNVTSDNIFGYGLSNGSHTIYFKVLDNQGLWSKEVSMDIYVNGKPRIWLESITPQNPTDEDNIHFIANSSDDRQIVNYQWLSSLDGKFYEGNKNNCYFDELQNGTHTIFVKVLDDNGTWSDVVQTTLVINGKPRAHISSITPRTVGVGGTVSFKGYGTDDGSIAEYEWKSDKDGVLNEKNIKEFSHELSRGRHTITFRVKDNDGVWSTSITSEVKVTEPPVAKLKLTSNSIDKGEIVTFDASESSDTGSIVNYNFHYGEGETGWIASSIYAHKYTNTGSFLVFIEVRDDDGNVTQSDKQTIKVTSSEETFLGLTRVQLTAVSVFFTIIAALVGTILKFRKNASEK